MANITVSDVGQPESGNLISRISHFMSKVFKGNLVQPATRNLGTLDDQTLADIGIRREQLPLSYQHFKGSDQRLYWV